MLITGKEALSNFKDETMHILTMILYELAMTEQDVEKRRRLLNEALQLKDETMHYRETKTPFHFWNKGASLYPLALVQAELANLESVKVHKISLLSDSAAVLEDALELCKLHFAPAMAIPRQSCVPLGTSSARLASVLTQLYDLTPGEGLRKKILSALKQAVEFYEKAGWPSRAAEAHWKMAEVFNEGGNYSEAFREFGAAAQAYEKAGTKISQFRQFFVDYALYMKAWGEVERARLNTQLESYDVAAKHYREAARILSRTRRWLHTAPYYTAHSHLQKAEALSKKEKFQESTAGFMDAGKEFSQTESVLKTRLDSAGTPQERDQVETLLKASQVRRQYCHARAVLKQARQHDTLGDKIESARHYALAADTLQEVVPLFETSKERDEVKAMVDL